METREELEARAEHWWDEWYRMRKLYNAQRAISEDLEGGRRKVADICIIIATSTVVLTGFVHVFVFLADILYAAIR